MLESAATSHFSKYPDDDATDQHDMAIVSEFIANLMRKFFRGRVRDTVVTSAGNSLKVVTNVNNRHCLEIGRAHV